MKVIQDRINNGELPQYYQLTESDVGEQLDYSSRGPVLESDIGKHVCVTAFGVVLKESMEEKKERNEMQATVTNINSRRHERRNTATPATIQFGMYGVFDVTLRDCSKSGVFVEINCGYLDGQVFSDPEDIMDQLDQGDRMQLLVDGSNVPVVLRWKGYHPGHNAVGFGAEMITVDALAA